jgi:hypothetical protein
MTTPTPEQQQQAMQAAWRDLKQQIGRTATAGHSGPHRRR